MGKNKPFINGVGKHILLHGKINMDTYLPYFSHQKNSRFIPKIKPSRKKHEFDNMI